jgi:hypothetical protein
MQLSPPNLELSFVQPPPIKHTQYCIYRDLPENSTVSHAHKQRESSQSHRSKLSGEEEEMPRAQTSTRNYDPSYSRQRKPHRATKATQQNSDTDTG